MNVRYKNFLIKQEGNTFNLFREVPTVIRDKAQAKKLGKEINDLTGNYKTEELGWSMQMESILNKIPLYILDEDKGEGDFKLFLSRYMKEKRELKEFINKIFK